MEENQNYFSESNFSSMDNEENIDYFTAMDGEQMMEDIKNYFSQSHFTSMEQMANKKIMIDYQNDKRIKQAFFMSSLFIMALMIGILVAGFMAVPHLCPDNSERGKNTRLGLYFLLLVTGGQIGWLYIILWLANINFCA
jgi:hypothetical protein